MSIDEFGQPSPKKGMGTGMKIVLVLLCLGGGVMLLCCGGGFYLFSQFNPEFKRNDPQAAAKTAQEIVTIEVAEQFQPSDSMTMGGELFGFSMNMKMATYRAVEGQGFLVLMQLHATNMPKEFQDAQARQQMERQGLDNRQLNNIGQPETREFEIRGRKVPFLFSKAKDTQTGKVIHLVNGTFADKDGLVTLVLQIEEEFYDEEAVVRMLESIE